MTNRKQLRELVFSVSDAEIEVLQHVWAEYPLTAADIIERMDSENSTHPRTIKTLINRLLKKGVLGYEEKNRKYLYFPTIGKEDFYEIKTQHFLNKFFGGELSPLVSMFTEKSQLSEKEISQLKSLIDTMDNKRGRKS